MIKSYLRFRDGFASILDPRLHTIEWLDGQVFSGLARVWAAADAVLLTEIKTYPTGAFEVHVLAAVGNIETLTGHLIKQVEAWAAEHGAIYVSIASRPGWVRVMAPHGYQLWQSEIRKEV